MAIYLKLDGIKGSVTTAGFEDQIELASFDWTSQLTIRVGSVDRTTSRAALSEIVVTKVADKASQKLFKALIQGEHITTGTIAFTAATKGESVSFMKIDIFDVIISFFRQASAGDLPMETLHLNISKFTYSWVSRTVGQKELASRLIWNTATNQVE